MKRVIEVLIAVVLVASLSSIETECLAQSTPIYGPSPTLTAAPTKAPDQAPLSTVFGNTPLNLTGDTIWLGRSNQFVVGIGMDVITYKGIFNFRVEAAQGTEANTFMGAGPLINIPSLLNLIPGTTWNAKVINPSIGILGGYDFNKRRGEWGVLLSIIQLPL